jgi:hypothetical protein
MRMGRVGGCAGVVKQLALPCTHIISVISICFCSLFLCMLSLCHALLQMAALTWPVSRYRHVHVMCNVVCLSASKTHWWFSDTRPIGALPTFAV